MMNGGKTKEERVEKFKQLLDNIEKYRHVNQYK